MRANWSVRRLNRVANTKSDEPDEGHIHDRQRGLSWTAMLAIVALAIVVAVGIAYLLIDPFFHQPRR